VPKQSHQTLVVPARASTSLDYHKNSIADRPVTEANEAVAKMTNNITIDVGTINLNSNTITVTKPKTKPEPKKLESPKQAKLKHKVLDLDSNDNSDQIPSLSDMC
jgi:lipopolysaccharide export system protein LptA